MHAFGPNNNSNPFYYQLKIEGINIERIGYRFKTKSFKLVGIMLDDKLNWAQHAGYIRGKLSRANYALARAKRILPLKIKLMTYNSLLKCHMDYCQPIWGNCPASYKRGFLKLQKTAVRNISLSSYNHHSEPLFKRLKSLNMMTF